MDSELFRRVDLWLLGCLDALIVESSVTRAAERMGVSQPAMSNALARLRAIVRDPILLRTASGMVPTPRGLLLAESIRGGCRAIESALFEAVDMDFATDRRRIELAMTDHPAMDLLPQLFERVGALAPGIALSVQLPEPTRMRQRLEAGECDLAIGYFPDLPHDLRSSVLYADQVCVVSRRGHAAFEHGMTLEAYAGARHITFGSACAPLSTLETAITQTLAEMGIERRCSGRAPSLALSCVIAANSTLVATLPARLYRSFGSLLPLSCHALPFELPRVEVRMAWHERTQNDPAHRWLRQLIRDICSARDATTGSEIVADAEVVPA